MAANDHSRLGVVHQDETHDYAAIMAYCQDERNWFKRARGEWDEAGVTNVTAGLTKS